jgi:hypothetical protein
MLLTVALSACATPYSTPKILQEGAKATGIADALRADNVVDVLLVHGMCTHGKKWVAEVNHNLLDMLGSEEEIENGDLEVTETFSQVELYSREFDVAGKKLRTHAIVWSPITVAVKKALCYDHAGNRDKGQYCEGIVPYAYHRAAANESLKTGLLDDCLADAVIYSGRTGKEIRRQFGAAIEYVVGMLSRAADQDSVQEQETGMFIITESLGSKVLFDTLYELNCAGKRGVTARVLGWTPRIFMGANQVPMLTLAARTPGGTEECPLDDESMELCPRNGAKAFGEDPSLDLPVDSLNLLIRQLRQSRPKFDEEPPMNVVAFSDPNDLLSYTLKDSGCDQLKYYQTIDVLVSNAPAWFGLLEFPLTAHTGYWINKEVHKIIGCGIPAQASCRLK